MGNTNYYLQTAEAVYQNFLFCFARLDLNYWEAITQTYRALKKIFQ